jgi:hypothetical protein
MDSISFSCWLTCWGPATHVNHKGRCRCYERVPEWVYPYLRMGKQVPAWLILTRWVYRSDVEPSGSRVVRGEMDVSNDELFPRGLSSVLQG